MVPSKKFTVRLAIYSVVLLYVAGDLFVFNGPLNRRIQASRPDSPESLARARDQGVVARAMGRSIYLSQVERATRERLWLRGLSLEDLTPEQRRSERLAALNDLVDHEILRAKVKANANELPVSEEDIDAAVKRLAARFASRDEMQRELEAEGIDSEKELRYRLAARLQQIQWIERGIASEIEIGEDELRAFFESNRERFTHPPRVRARHIFLATLQRDPAAAKATLEQALAELRSERKSFAELAAALSDDPRTKSIGGDLGWMSETRLPADFAQPVFAMQVGKPQLLRTKIGWHLVEVTDRLAAEPRDFDEARDEARAALESARRIEMVRNFRHAMRHTDDIGVHLFTDMIPSE